MAILQFLSQSSYGEIAGRIDFEGTLDVPRMGVCAQILLLGEVVVFLTDPLMTPERGRVPKFSFLGEVEGDGQMGIIFSQYIPIQDRL